MHAHITSLPLWSVVTLSIKLFLHEVIFSTYCAFRLITMGDNQLGCIIQQLTSPSTRSAAEKQHSNQSNYRSISYELVKVQSQVMNNMKPNSHTCTSTHRRELVMDILINRNEDCNYLNVYFYIVKGCVWWLAFMLFILLFLCVCLSYGGWFLPFWSAFSHK